MCTCRMFAVGEDETRVEVVAPIIMYRTPAVLPVAHRSVPSVLVALRGLPVVPKSLRAVVVSIVAAPSTRPITRFTVDVLVAGTFAVPRSASYPERRR